MSSNDDVMYPTPGAYKPVAKRFQDENGHWRVHIVNQRGRFDDEAKHIFLTEYAKHSIMGRAAKAAGVTSNTVKRHMKEDEEFGEAVMAAREVYQAKLLEHHQDLVFNGVEKRTFDRNGNVISEETQYPIRLIELELKKVDPDYRDKREVDVTVQGGVLVAPADVGSIEDWEKKFTPLPKGDGEKTEDKSVTIDGEIAE